MRRPASADFCDILSVTTSWRFLHQTYFKGEDDEQAHLDISRCGVTSIGVWAMHANRRYKPDRMSKLRKLDAACVAGAKHPFANPQQAGIGAAQMFIGGAGAGMAVYQRNPNGVPTSAAGMVRGWNNWQQGGAYVQPPMTVPAPRPSYPRW